ncbi:MAG: DUF3798 domain-containing protein [Synergistaceae bacterium]|jgi:hypothetical protein|nr:DUF3798 domain-containing protein [Synergistaceae bacterium]
MLSAVPAGAGEAPFHIGIMTGTVSQSEDDLRGAERLLAEYGDADKGGMVRHITYPDNFMAEMETTVSQLLGLADDPKMKVIVTHQSVPGVAEAFRRIREKRPDILLFAGEAHEDPNIISSVADLVVNTDLIARSYTIPLTAQKLGVKTFVYVSFPRHMSYENLSRSRAIMESTCKDLGLKFVFETAPDPLSDVGVAGAQQYMLEKVPTWIDQYGKETAFFTTNDALVEPMLKRVAELGAYFIETGMSSPLMGYPGALGIDLSKEKGDWPAILKKVEAAVVAAGGGGRMGTWAYSYGYTNASALAEYGKRIVEGKARPGNRKDILDAYNKYTPGAQWSATYYTDAGTGVRKNNFLLIRQDTYILGKGYMHMTDVEIPEKVFSIK